MNALKFLKPEKKIKIKNKSTSCFKINKVINSLQHLEVLLYFIHESQTQMIYLYANITVVFFRIN